MSDGPTVSAPRMKFPPQAIFAVGLVAGFLVYFVRPAPIWPQHDLDLRTVGILLVVVGLATAGWAMLTFRAGGTSSGPTPAATRLVRTGPYRFSRNPLDVGLAAASVGFALFWNALWPLLSVPIAMVLVRRLVIPREEQHLLERFGDEYRQYLDDVRRWI